ncbi:MAG: aminotransferase class IV [Luteolibacter sp.]
MSNYYMAIVWHDGKFLDEKEFRISPFDRGLCHGLTFFETLLAVDGCVRLLGEHLERLRGGLERLGVMSVELADEGLKAAMEELLRRNGLEKGLARIRFALSMGEGPMNELDAGSVWAWMTVSPVGVFSEAVRVTVAPWRKDKESVLRGLKVGNYAEHLIALDLARREGFDEMLFFNSDDELCEAAMGNVFLIKGGKLFTPGLDSGCLAGITRALILRVAKAKGISVHEKPLGKSDLKKAEGIFLTSSVKGPVWVSSFGGKGFEVHPLFHGLRASWLEEMSMG